MMILICFVGRKFIKIIAVIPYDSCPISPKPDRSVVVLKDTGYAGDRKAVLVSVVLESIQLGNGKVAT
jgi:hypothetical protein